MSRVDRQYLTTLNHVPRKHVDQLRLTRGVSRGKARSDQPHLGQSAELLLRPHPANFCRPPSHRHVGCRPGQRLHPLPVMPQGAEKRGSATGGRPGRVGRRRKAGERSADPPTWRSSTTKRFALSRRPARAERCVPRPAASSPSRKCLASAGAYSLVLQSDDCPFPVRWQACAIERGSAAAAFEDQSVVRQRQTDVDDEKVRGDTAQRRAGSPGRCRRAENVAQRSRSPMTIESCVEQRRRSDAEAGGRLARPNGDVSASRRPQSVQPTIDRLSAPTRTARLLRRPPATATTPQGRHHPL